MRSDQALSKREGENTVVTGAETSGPRQVIEQAASDIARGLQDTDRHGIPAEVPGPGAENQQAAEVPPQGVDRKNFGKGQLGGKAGRQ